MFTRPTKPAEVKNLRARLPLYLRSQVNVMRATDTRGRDEKPSVREVYAIIVSNALAFLEHRPDGSGIDLVHPDEYGIQYDVMPLDAGLYDRIQAFQNKMQINSLEATFIALLKVGCELQAATQ